MNSKNFISGDHMLWEAAIIGGARKFALEIFLASPAVRRVANNMRRVMIEMGTSTAAAAENMARAIRAFNEAA